MLFECRYSYFPPLTNFHKTWNYLILVKNERIKRKVRCRMTKWSTFSWGSVSTSLLEWSKLDRIGFKKINYEPGLTLNKDSYLNPRVGGNI